MDEEAEAGVEVEDQYLAVAANVTDCSPGEGRPEPAGRAVQHRWAQDSHRLDGAADEAAGQVATDGLDFRELRHD
jgi:hypothetical protein